MGEVPFLVYELEDEDAVAAFWEAASSVGGAKDCKDESERRVCPDDGKLSLSRKLLGISSIISSHRTGSVESKGGELLYIAFIGFA